MKIHNQISSRLCCLGVVLTVLAALSIFPQSLRAGTSWTGGGGADTTVTNALNWGGVVNSLDGTTVASFVNSSNLCTLNTNAYFTTVTFSPQSAASGFTIAGPSNLVVKGSASGGTKNIIVSSGALGNVTNNAPLQVNTTAAFLVMQVNKAVTLAINNGISASSGTYSLRHEGVVNSTARIAGPISGLAAVQMASGTWAGDLIIAGSQSLGSADVTINNSAGFGNPALTARLILGESLSDVQTWKNFSLNRFMDVVIKGNVTAGTFSVLSNAIVEVPGSLSATTLGLGTAGQTGSLKVSGAAYFSGAVTIGATAGNTIVGNSASIGTLVLSSGTINGNVTIGGGGANDNNIKLIKTNSGALTLGGTHTYTGNTVVQAGRLDLAGTIVSSITVSNGASLGGEGATTGSITFGAGATSVYFDPGTPGVLTANSINAGAGTVVINPIAGGDGVVLQSSTPIVGSVGANFILASRGGTLSFDGTGTQLLFTNGSSTPANLKWAGNSANPTYWDSGVTLNWSNGVVADRFYTGDSVTFDDSASSFAVSVQGGVIAGNLVCSNTANAYTISGSGIGGNGSFVKYGSNTVTLANSSANTFTNGMTNYAGLIIFSSLNQLGAFTNAPIELVGGSLGYTNTGAGNALDANFKLSIAANGVDIAVLSSNVYLGRGQLTGSGDWSKSGPGWLLLGNNSDTSTSNNFTGKLTVKAGMVDIRHSDSLGTTTGITEVQDGASLLVQNFLQTSGGGINCPEPLLFSGNSYLTMLNQESKTFTDTFSGPVTNAAGGTLSLSTPKSIITAVSTLALSGGIDTGAGSIIVLGRIGLVPVSYITNCQQIINVGGSIAGAGSLVTESGTNTSLFTLSAANTYTGSTTISGGTLALAGSGSIANTPVITVNANGILDVSGVTFTLGAAQKLTGGGKIAGNVTANGTIIPGASIGTLTFSNNLTINGNLVVELNKSLAQSNDVITVLGTLNNTGTGTLTVSNLGPALVVGDKFTLFSQAVTSGDTLNISTPTGVTFTNNLALDGSISVLTVPATTANYSTNINASISGSTLTLVWPSTHLGWFLQSQTNALNVGLTTPTNTWFDIIGSDVVTNKNITINPANPSVFFRLRHP